LPVLALLALLPGFVCAIPAAAADENKSFPCGLCYAADENGQRILVPLESTEVILDVKPGLIETQVIQTFTNRSATALEATYLYPLPDGATLTDFELRFQDRVIRSVVREKAAARLAYETAKAEGKKTALLEQHDPSLFSTAVANFLPGETVQVVIRFLQPLTLSLEAVEIRFPMVTGDKYFPADATPGQPGTAAPNPPRNPSDRISQQHVYAFDIQVAGIPVQTIQSPSHQIKVEDRGGDRFAVYLEKEITIPDRDFLLRIETRQTQALLPTVVTQRTSTGDYGLLTVFPPVSRPTSPKIDQPRDVLFLLDRSGSMQGTRINSAKLGLEGCLAMLRPADRFQIVTFSDRHSFYRPAWIPATAAEIDAARKHVRSITADGGTEMQPALRASLDFFQHDERQHLVIFLTDGDVGDTDALLNLIESKLGTARLFTFGIGAAPNATLIRRMAELGRGQARFIADDRGIERELVDLMATLAAPVISDLHLALLDSGGHPVEATFFPEKTPDVFLGRPLQIVFRTSGQSVATLQMLGREDDRPITLSFPLQTTPLRGDGIEKHFGRTWYQELEDAGRRAVSPEDKAAARKRMLDVAMLFQLVTEQTSRVAVEERISRDPSAPLASQQVAQAHPADQNQDVIELLPFSVEADAEGGYTANSTLSGSRLRSRLTDVAGCVTVLTQEFFQDLAPTRVEDALPFVMEPAQNPVVVRSGADTGLLDELPIATTVDPATVDQIAVRSFGPAWSNLSQSEAGGAAGTSLIARVGEEGFASASLRSSVNFGGDRRYPALAVLSWAEFGQPQWNAYLAARQTLGDSCLRTSFQWRQLAGFGDLRLARATFEHRVSDALTVEATAAWHQLNRANPQQFRLNSPTARYDGLGFFNLDLLTADTDRLEDAIAEVKLSGTARTAEVTYRWTVRGRWSRQESGWLTPSAAPATGAHRDTQTVDLFYRAGFAHDRLGLELDLGGAEHRSPGETTEDQSTRKASLGSTVELCPAATLFGNWAHEEILPWVSTGVFRRNGGDLRRQSHTPEKRAGGQLGLRVAAMDNRVSGTVGIFHDNVSNHAFRDWAWESAHPGPGASALPDGGLRLPASYSVWKELVREGWMGSFDFNPTPSLTTTASWYCDWKNAGPYRGGNRRASLVARYSFRHGVLHGFGVGGGVSYRNAMSFNDADRLPGGTRGDLFLTYHGRTERFGNTLLQLKLANLTNRPWPLTRFAPDRGRQVLLSIAQKF